MIYTTATIEKRMDKMQESSASVNRAKNPTRAAYEDGFANGLADVFPTVHTQEIRIAELEELLKKFMQLGTPDGNDDCEVARANLLTVCPEYCGYLKTAQRLVTK
jgi:hypothetical protein